MKKTIKNKLLASLAVSVGLLFLPTNALANKPTYPNVVPIEPIAYPSGVNAENATYFYFTGITNPRAKHYNYSDALPNTSSKNFKKSLLNDSNNNENPFVSVNGGSYWARTMNVETYANQYKWFTPVKEQANANAKLRSHMYENNQRSFPIYGANFNYHYERARFITDDIGYADYKKYFDNQSFKVKGKVVEAGTSAFSKNVKAGYVTPEMKYVKTYNEENIDKAKSGGGIQALENHAVLTNKFVEWRQNGYSAQGTIVPNPLFPPDFVDNKTYTGFQNIDSFSSHWSKKDWLVHKGGNYYYNNSLNSSASTMFKSLFGNRNLDAAKNTYWIENYFLKEYPNFKTATKDANYWKDRIIPLTDPSLGATTWIGIHNPNLPYYVLFTTKGDIRPNIRVEALGLRLKNNDETSSDMYTIYKYRENPSSNIVNVSNPVGMNVANYNIGGKGLLKPIDYEFKLGQDYEVDTFYSLHYPYTESKQILNINSKQGVNRDYFYNSLVEKHGNKVGNTDGISNYSKKHEEFGKDYNTAQLTNDTNIIRNFPADQKFFDRGAVKTQGILNVPKNTPVSKNGTIEIISYIPNQFSEKGYNHYQIDDRMHMQLSVGRDNLIPVFDSFRNELGWYTDDVYIGEDIFAYFKLLKKSGSKVGIGANSTLEINDLIASGLLDSSFSPEEGKPIYDRNMKFLGISDGKDSVFLPEDSKLDISFYNKDENDNIVEPSTMGTFPATSYNNPEKVVLRQGDFSIHIARIQAQTNKVCAIGMVPVEYGNRSPSPNTILDDDITEEICLESEDNIIVSNVKVKPKTTFITEKETSAEISYLVTFDLTNVNYKNTEKSIPVIVRDLRDEHKIYHKQEYSVQALRKESISVTIPKNSYSVGTVGFFVEANPEERKYIETRIDGRGPYDDNTGYDLAHVVQVDNPDWECEVAHKMNTWNDMFIETEYYQLGWYGPPYECGSEENPRTCIPCEHDPMVITVIEHPVSFVEKFQITHVYFKSKSIADKNLAQDTRDKGRNKEVWALIYANGNNIKNGKDYAALIKSGYGFNLRVYTEYNTPGYANIPRPWVNPNIHKCSTHYGKTDKQYIEPVATDNKELFIEMPFNTQGKISKPVKLNFVEINKYYYQDNPNNKRKYNFSEQYYYGNTIRVWELDGKYDKNTIKKDENKFYINPEVKDGNYKINIQTRPFYGSEDKREFGSFKDLCDNIDIYVQVKGSYLDDLKTHITD